ncbi:MAG: DUF4783 domain-containing protein [Bacteroidales bacterium]|nr:DUF4783 domain-containing protein [Bacteroidales bacterium]
MNRLLTAASVLIAMSFGSMAKAQVGYTTVTQNGYYDVFVPIAKYLACGDTESLSAWFADNLEITILHSTNDSSKNQARQILKSFFNTYTPRDFQILHNAGRANMKYALGSLNAGGEIFMVTIFVSSKDDIYKIQQLKIERIE